MSPLDIRRHRDGRRPGSRSGPNREYLGEAYISRGRVDIAKAELAKIEKIAGSGSEQYRTWPS